LHDIYVRHIVKADERLPAMLKEVIAADQAFRSRAMLKPEARDPLPLKPEGVDF
jgi:hypothetical protein